MYDAQPTNPRNMNVVVPEELSEANVKDSLVYRIPTALSVFAQNLRAREVYQRLGYGEDIMKYVKELT